MRYTLILCILISSLAFAEAEHKPYAHQDAEKLATAMGVVYVTMPKAELYKVFTPHHQKGYYKDGNEEWITFSDWQTDKSGDLITFYLRDGIVRGWDE